MWFATRSPRVKLGILVLLVLIIWLFFIAAPSTIIRTLSANLNGGENDVGYAYARKYQGNEHGVMAVFGDGATNGGAFFESLNIASAWKLPVLFLCENNGWAIGTSIDRVAPFHEQHRKAKPYMPTMEVDGMDAVAVYETVKEAQRYIEEGHGPIFVEAYTCRYEGHSMSDAATYRSPQEMQICKAKDPIERMKKYLEERFGVKAVYIFGSVRGDTPFHEGSDIDIAVEGLPPERYFEALRALGGLRIAIYCGILIVSIIQLPEGFFHYLARKYHQFERIEKIR
jgi:predicted nucleotidyltransferase